MFIQEFTNGVQVHIEDLITRMKACKNKQYGLMNTTSDAQAADGDGEAAAAGRDLETIQKTDFFTKLTKKIRKNADSIDVKDLVKKCKQFDDATSHCIKVYHLINVLNHNLPGMFPESDLIGLQYELESLSYDQTVDYRDFFNIFFINDQATKGRKGEKEDFKLEIQKKQSAYTLMDYEEVLSSISVHVRDLGLDLEHIFGIFTKQGGFIEYFHIRKIFELIDFPITDKEFDIITLYADETGVGTILAYDLMQQIINAERVAPQFEIYKWIIASRELGGRVHLLETVLDRIEHLNEAIDMRYGADVKIQGGEAHREPPRVLTGEQF